MSNIRCELNYLFYSSDLGDGNVDMFNYGVLYGAVLERKRYPANGSSTIKLWQRYGTFL